MKKFNFVIIFLTVFFFLALGGYIFFLDAFNKTQKIEKEIQSLKKIKDNLQRPLIEKADANELMLKESEYKEIVQKLDLNADVALKDDALTISGSISDTYNYMMVKRVLNIIKNDDATLEQTCLGVGCNEYEYGFFIKFSPFVLKYE